MKTVLECKLECGEEEKECEFCEHNTAKAIVGDEVSAKEWFAKAKIILGKEPSARQSFRAGWILRQRLENDPTK